MQQPLTSIEPVIDRLFMALHGYYGNQFLDKFRTGQQRADGSDVGVENAKKVWGRELERYEPDMIGKALAMLRDRGAKFPPSLPEFIELCKVHRQPAPMESRLEYLSRTGQEPPATPEAKARFDEAMAKLRLRQSGGIGGLLANVAKAIALAGGGDEARELRRLEEEIFRRG